MSVTLTGGSRGGWIRATLYDQTGAQVAMSSGNQSGFGHSTTFPATLSAPAPAAAGTYTWKMSYYGNLYTSGRPHGEITVNTNSFTVAGATDTTAPTVSAFTLPATATSLTVPVSSFTATDNVAVTGYLVTTTSTAPAASATGWTASAPTSVTAPAAGTVTFYAWAKDAAGNVSASRSATVTITLPDTTLPTVSAFTMPTTSNSLTVSISSFTASDNVAVTGYLVTTTSTKPAATATGWTATAPTSATAAAAGSVTFYAWAKDAAGNVSNSRSATVTITIADTTLPTVSAFTLPVTSTSLTVPVSSFTASDNVAVTGYLVTTTSTKPAATATGWTATAPTSVTAAAAGTVTFYAWAKDAAGNVSNALSATVTITLPDTTLPTVSAFTMPATSNSLTVSISSFTASDNVAVTGYLVTTTSTKPAATATGWTATAPTSASAAAAGTVTFYAWAKDAAGNVSNSRSATVTITLADTTLPTVSAFTMPTSATSLTVPISSFTASDNVAVTGYLVTTTSTKPSASATGWTATAPTSATAAAAGTVTFYAWAKDAAGNVSNSRSATVTITIADTTLPTVSAFTMPATSTSLTVPVSSFTASDNVAVTGYLVTTTSTKPAASATGWTATAPTSVTAPAAGAVTFYAWAKDAAGNVSNALSATVTITLPDTTLPTVSAFTLPATATSLTVSVSSFTASDNVAVTGYLVTTTSTKPAASDTGWTATAPTSVTAPAAGSVTFYAWAKDAAGNVSNSRSAAVTITLPDTTLPTVTAFTLPATSTSLTVPVTSFTASDNVAVTGYLVTTTSTKPAASATGWTATAPTSVTAPAAGAVTFYAWAKDAAGNVSNSRSATVTITIADTTLPTVSAFTLPSTSSSLIVSVSSFTASDNVAVAGYLVTTTSTKPAASATGWTATAPTSVTAAAAGTVTFYAWAKDAAGNVSNSRSATVTITIVIPPPAAVGNVNQNIGIYDTKFGNLYRNDCLVCHVSDTVLVTRHHTLVQTKNLQCLDCHTQVPDGTGGYTFADFRTCEVCHKTTPHHVTVQAASRDCAYCHGKLVDNYNDGHFIPTYSVSDVTPIAGFKAVPDANDPTKTVAVGGCRACHVDNASAIDPDTNTVRPVYANADTHHGTGLQTCAWCHDTSGVEFTNIRTCETCHGVKSIHNIQVDSANTANVGTVVSGGETKGWGHIGANEDCWGCHGWYDKYDVAPDTDAVVAWIEKLSATLVNAGSAWNLTISGTSFVNDSNGIFYTPKVEIGGKVYTPAAYTNNSITVAVPALPVGNYDVRVLKNGQGSNKANFSVKPTLKVTSASGVGKTATFIGTGFSTAPLANTQSEHRVVINGVVAKITSWTDTKIVATVPTTIANRAPYTITTIFGPVSGTVTVSTR